MKFENFPGSDTWNWMMLDFHSKNVDFHKFWIFNSQSQKYKFLWKFLYFRSALKETAKNDKKPNEKTLEFINIMLERQKNDLKFHA